MVRKYNSKDNFIKYSKEVHGDKFSYDLISDEDIKNVNSKVKLQCNKCNYIFDQCIHNHVNHKQGCIKCSGKLPWTLSSFLDKAKEVHNNKYNYSLITNKDVSGFNSILNIKCNVCDNIYKQTLSSHIKGHGCRVCSKNDPWTLDRFKVKSKEIHNNKYNYSLIKKGDIKNSFSKLKIKCNSCNNTFTQSITLHINGKHGCNICAGNLAWSKRKGELEGLLKKYYDNSFIIPNINVIKNNTTKIAIICKQCNKKIIRGINQLLNKKVKCPSCKQQKYSSKDFLLDKCLKVHNDKYDYSLITNDHVNSALSIIKIKCKKCDHIFNQSINNHINNKQGCPSCAGKINYNLSLFLKKTKDVHKNKFNYSLIKDDDIKDSSSIIKIICNSCNEKFSSKVSSHLINKIDCPNCVKNSPLTKDKFLKKVQEAHGNIYDYSKNDLNDLKSNKRIIIICNKCDFKFKQRVSDHMSGSGCLKCRYRMSKKEIKWLDNFNIKKDNRQISLPKLPKRLKVDGYDPETNTVYEFYGDFWHGNPKVYNSNDVNTVSKKTFGQLYKNTIARENKIKEAGYNIVSMWENDFKEVK